MNLITYIRATPSVEYSTLHLGHVMRFMPFAVLLALITHPTSGGTQNETLNGPTAVVRTVTASVTVWLRETIISIGEVSRIMAGGKGRILNELHTSIYLSEKDVPGASDQLARMAPRILRTLASGRGMYSHAHGMRRSRGIPRPLYTYGFQFFHLIPCGLRYNS